MTTSLVRILERFPRCIHGSPATPVGCHITCRTEHPVNDVCKGRENLRRMQAVLKHANRFAISGFDLVNATANSDDAVEIGTPTRNSTM